MYCIILPSPMPRKTRKEKERARQRSLVNREMEFSLEELSLPQKIKKMPEKVDKSIPIGTAHSIVPDLVKTTLFALGIFSLEVVVYLRWFR